MIEKVPTMIEKLLSGKKFLPDEIKEEFLGEMPDYDKYLQDKENLSIKRNKVNPPPWILPSYIEPMLTREQETHQFRKYNILKHFAVQKTYSDEQIDEILSLREKLSLCNYRLAIHHVKKRYPEVFEDVVSDAYIRGMLRAVECFDWRKGIKFSTYLSWILINNSIRYVGREKVLSARYQTSGVIDYFDNSESYDLGYVEERRSSRAKAVLEKLLDGFQEKDSDRMKYILQHRFGIVDEKRTLEDIGNFLGVSKERVRQLESRALELLNRHAKKRKIVLELDA